MGSLLSKLWRGSAQETGQVSQRVNPQLPTLSTAQHQVRPDESSHRGTSSQAASQSPSSLPLWDSSHPDQQEIVAMSPRYKDLLKKKLPELTELVQLSQMWVHLIALDVIDRLGRDRISHNVTREDAVDRLVHHLENGPTWKLHSFVRALAKTDQPHIIHLLGLTPADYEDPPAPCQPPPSVSHIESGRGQAKARKQHYYKAAEDGAMLQISNDLLPGVLQHCGSYNQTLMKTSLFGYQKNVPIDLTRIYIHHEASCRKNQREKMPVSKKELFQCLFGTRSPKCLSMEGPAGTGKSSYLEEYAHDWSHEVTSCDKKVSPCEGHMWKLVVYIPAGGIKGTATEAIKDNLRCKPHPQDQMMNTIEEDGDGVLIMYDGIDELRRKDSIKSISTYVETSWKTPGTPKVLLSARDGLLSVERRLFDRELSLVGFSLAQGISYMKQYFKEMHSLSDHPVLQYVDTHQQDLEWVLSNPLRVHIFSELTACDFLTLQDIQTLTTVKLFRSLDNLLFMRDKECRPSPSSQPPNFYQACLRCLLTDTRTLSEVDIGSDSQYLSLLQRHNYMDQDFQECCNFTFPHEVLFEYFSMRGLIECLMHSVESKQGLLMCLCCNKKMRNVLQLTCGYIAQYVPQLLPDVVFIIRASLILQTEYVWCEQNELTQELLQLPAVIEETFPPNIFTHDLTAEQKTKLSGISNLIQAMFNEKADLLKDAGWFFNGHDKDINRNLNKYVSPFHQFLLGCLQQMTPQQLEEVFSQTINQLLMCTGDNLPSVFNTGYPRRSTGRFTVVPVGGVRWAAVGETSDYSGFRVTVTMWSACDLLSVLNTWSHLPRVQQLLQDNQVRYRVHVDRSAHTLCTSLPADPWSEEQWTPGLRELLSPRYCTGWISVLMGYDTQPLSGLMSACRELITPGHGLTEGLNIIWGQVQEDDLTGFCTWAGEVGLSLELWWLTVVLRAGCGKEDWKDVDSAIRRMIEVGVGGRKGELHQPTYMTAEGEVLCERYRPGVDNEDSDLESVSQSQSDTHGSEKS